MNVNFSQLGPLRLQAPADIWAAWVALTLAMVGYWLLRCGKTRVLTFDVFFVALYLYVPIVFMSIFAFSPWNEVATGDWHYRYAPKIREALYVSLLGAGVFLLAAWWAARRNSPPAGYRLVYHAIRDFWGTRLGLTLLVLLFAALGVVVVATVGVVSAREVGQTHTEFRPTSHLFSTFGVVAIYISLVEGYRQSSWKLTGLGVVLTLLLLGFGTRKVTVGTILYYTALRMINLRPKRRAAVAALAGVVVTLLVIAALGVEIVRQQDFSTERLLAAPVALIFGNNLSELRDFAWMLSTWDYEPLMGQTYISGMLAFIPSYLLPVRKEFSWGTFSTHMTGLDVGNHPGLRPTLFAEAYFNFDLVGVILYAMFLGAIFGRVSAFAERRLRDWPPRERALPLLCCFLYFEFFLRCQQSANCFQSYIDLMLLAMGLAGAWVWRQYRLRTPPPRSVAAVGAPAASGFEPGPSAFA